VQASGTAHERRNQTLRTRPKEAGSTGLLRRNHDFRLLWCGETAGKFGASITSVAMPLVAVSTLQSSTFEVSLLSAAAWMPWLVIGLPAGAWVDRLRRRPVMMGAATLSFLLSAAIPPLAWTGRLSINLLIAIALVAGTAAVFFQAAYTAYLPEILEPADQPEGNAKLHGSASAAQIAGSASAGLIAQLVGVVNAMFADAATFLISFSCLTRIRHRETPAARSRESSTALLSDIGEGLRLVASDPWLRPLTLCGAAMNAAMMAYQAILVVFLVRTVGLPPGAVGALMAVTGVGGVAGAFMARRISYRIGTARALQLFLTGFTVFGLLIPATSDGLRLVLYIVGAVCVTMGAVAGNVINATFRQSYCPPHLLGRLTTSAAFLNYGAIPLGALLGGWLGTVFDLRTAIWITTAAIPVASLILLASPIRHSRDLPTATVARV
jgi:predicted MFS family arabinose efflux permease